MQNFWSSTLRLVARAFREHCKASSNRFLDGVEGTDIGLKAEANGSDLTRVQSSKNIESQEIANQRGRSRRIPRSRGVFDLCGQAVTGLARSEGAAAQPRSQSGGPDGSRSAAQNAASLSRSGATTERRRAEGWRRWRKIVTTWFTTPSGPKKMNDQQRRQRTAHSAGEIGPNARLKGNA